MAFKIYTKTGDRGQISLWGGARVPKHHIRVEAYGTIDELNAQLGVVRDHITVNVDERNAQLNTIQHRLFTIGAILATDPAKTEKLEIPDLHESDVELLEQWIDEMNKELPPLKNFILPGGHPAVSFCHVARCVCRRAERLVVTLSELEDVIDLVLQYLNRLSDYLFVLSRQIGQDIGVAEVIWKTRK